MYLTLLPLAAHHFASSVIRPAPHRLQESIWNSTDTGTDAFQGVAGIDTFIDSKRVPEWTPGVCYWITNLRELDNERFRALTEPLYECKELSPTVTSLIIGMLVLGVVRILLQLIWYMR